MLLSEASMKLKCTFTIEICHKYEYIGKYCMAGADFNAVFTRTNTHSMRIVMRSYVTISKEFSNANLFEINRTIQFALEILYVLYNAHPIRSVNVNEV